MRLIYLILFTFCLNFLSAKENSFVILIPSYNNSKYVIDNLSSCVNQNYNNFRVIYVNDKSNDDTSTKANEFIQSSPNGFRVELIENSSRMYALSNIYTTIHNVVCDDEIVVLVDGDDKLAHDNVLHELNNVYNSDKPLVTYGQYAIETSRGLSVGNSQYVSQKVIARNGFRKSRTFPYTHLRTFYAWLFKRIPRHGFVDSSGNFFRSAWDLAIMYPLLEMSNGKYKFIDKILYIYNASNPISDHKVRRSEQYTLSNYIKRQKPYNGLSDTELPKFLFED